MNIRRHINRPGRAVVLLQWVLLVALYIVFANRFWFDFGPDFVNYNAIARQYANGNWHDAVNTWWSPLYSWLLAAVQTVFPDPLLSNKILQCLAATGGWWLGRSIIRFHTGAVQNWPAEIISTATIPFWVYWGLRSDTPDLIGAVLLLHCFYGILKLRRLYSGKTAIATGITAALAYLCKGYNFYFITAAGVLLLIVLMIQAAFNAGATYMPQRREGTKISLRRSILVAKQWTTIALPFLLIAFTWMGVMQQKSGRFQPSAIGIHQDCDYTAPNGQVFHMGVYNCAGLQLHKGSLISNWEQPQLYPMITVKEYLKESKTSITRTWLQNIRCYLRDFSSAWLWVLLVVLAIVCAGEISKWWWLYAAWCGIYVAGYALFHLEARFFIMPGALIMIAVGWLLVMAIQKWEVPLLWPVALAATVLLFVRWPLHSMLHFERRTIPYQVYLSWKHAGKPLYKNKNLAAQRHLFDAGLYYSFYSGGRFYGTLTIPETGSEGETQLKQQQIDYLIVPLHGDGFVAKPVAKDNGS